MIASSMAHCMSNLENPSNPGVLSEISILFSSPLEKRRNNRVGAQGSRLSKLQFQVPPRGRAFICETLCELSRALRVSEEIKLFLAGR